VNARIRRAVKAREHFPTEQAALTWVYIAITSLDPTGTAMPLVDPLETSPQRLGRRLRRQTLSRPEVDHVRMSASRSEHVARQARPIGCLGVFPLVETRGIEPLTPALQRRCSAN
jgi:hypothetical protein